MSNDTPHSRLQINVQGMTCASCAGRVEKALKAMEGVEGAAVNLAMETASVDVTTSTIGTADLIRVVEKAGYGASEVSREESRTDTDRYAASQRREARAVLIAAVLSAPLLIPMLADLAGFHWMLPAGCSSAWPRRCNSGSARASIAPAGCAEGRFRQHGPAGRARHQRGLWPQRLADVLRGSPPRPATPVFRSIGRGHHPDPDGQVAGSAREAPDHGRDPRPAGTAPRHRARAPRWRRQRRSDRPDPHRRPRRRAARRTHRGRRRHRRRHQPRR
jgi:copper chaperone CopZ